jgi:hypothetical protein
MSIKTKEMGKTEVRNQTIEGLEEYKIWKDEQCSSKSGVETFEWSLITLDSVAWFILRSQ